MTDYTIKCLFSLVDVVLASLNCTLLIQWTSFTRLVINLVYMHVKIVHTFKNSMYLCLLHHDIVINKAQTAHTQFSFAKVHKLLGFIFKILQRTIWLVLVTYKRLNDTSYFALICVKILAFHILWLYIGGSNFMFEIFQIRKFIFVSLSVEICYI